MPDALAFSAYDLRAARAALGLSAEAFARLVRVQSGRTVRRWEAGGQNIPGTVAVLTTALMQSCAVRRHFGVAIDGDDAHQPKES